MSDVAIQLQTNVKDHLDDYADFLNMGNITGARRSLQNLCDAIADLSKHHADKVTYCGFPLSSQVASSQRIEKDGIEDALGTLKAELQLANTLGKSLSDELFLHANVNEQKKLATQLNACVSRASVRSRALVEALKK